ncbi:hypothetical protein GHT06_014519 [Daphnia sinensis]|uniref:RRM domain-containing protein n=1 Tax=Daphnia sinensis TaxID=1820382 RepID=A0AAD5L7X8_9CRUS|nr:hypothetical protein GHT06_014519 [Daphnia sinensis]
MEEAVCINDYGQGCASDGNVEFETDQLVNMDMNPDGLMLELDAEDLSEIHRMVDEWELNFGALESSDGEELMKLIQIENPSQFDWPRHLGDVSPSCSNNTNANWGNTDELHDRLPSYYTALAPSRSAPWIPPSSQLVFNKLPAYITDMAPLDVAAISDNACGSVGQPGKKKLNLAEYRTRREKQLQQMQEEEEQQQLIKQEVEDKEKQEIEKKADIKRVKVEVDKMQCHTKQHRQAKEVKDEPEEGEVEEEEVKEKQQQQPVASIVKSRRIRSSRSPTRSYSSHSSSSRRYRSSSTSSYSSRSRSRSPSHRRGRRRRRSSSNSSSSSSSWHRKSRHNNSRRHGGRRRRTPTPPSRSSGRGGGYNDRSQQRRRQQQQQQQAERQRQIEERRVIYVGKLADGTTRSDLRRRFEPFGPVVDISLHFRERGDNYGFVTFAYKVDAYEAVEHGNDDPHLPKYDLSFGGRRAFCKETYADLDAVDDDGRSKANDVDFETLLRAVQVQLTRRPCS